MRHNGNRKIEVKKSDLIERVGENKKVHIKEYAKAVIAYKKEAHRQLAELTEKAKDGDLKIKLELVTPVDNSENYDKIIQMFEWDVRDIVELDLDEFNEYILDETAEAQHAKFSNLMYSTF